MKKALIFFLYFSLLGVFVTMTACSQEEDDGSSSSPSTGDGDSVIDDVPPEVVETTGFWINVLTEDQFTIVMSDRSKGFGKDCFIDVDSASNVNLNCDLDILEGDLYQYALDIQYNVPPGLCDHLRISPAWYWNQEAGVGPAVVDIEQDTLSDPPVAQNCDTQVTFSGAASTCALHPETYEEPTNYSGPKCVYDRTDEGLANCCFGDYILNTEPDEDADGNGDGPASIVTTFESWGGSASACISPYLTNGWEHFVGGFPVSSITAVPKDAATETPIGLNSVHTLAANAESTTSGVSTWANFFETTGDPHYHEGFYYNTAAVAAADQLESNLPYWIDPIDDRDGSLMSVARPFDSDLRAGRAAWQFSCLDAGFEVKHRINLYIREWNTLAAYANYISSEGATYLPDVGGVTGTEEGVGCDYDPAFPSELCNDRADFGDFLDILGGAYPTATGVNETDRVNYFPTRSYE